MTENAAIARDDRARYNHTQDMAIKNHRQAVSNRGKQVFVPDTNRLRGGVSAIDKTNDKISDGNHGSRLQ